MVFAILALLPGLAFQPMSTPARMLRREAMLTGAAAVAAAVYPRGAFAEETASGLSYKVLKTGTGGQPSVGDLISIRFKGQVTATGAVFDDIMSSPEGYYFRVGGGSILPGVEEAVKMMRTGDVWELSIPGKLAFGEKGRSSSPGKPRIPPNADITFLLEILAVPGKDDEFIGDDA